MARSRISIPATRGQRRADRTLEDPGQGREPDRAPAGRQGHPALVAGRLASAGRRSLPALARGRGQRWLPAHADRCSPATSTTLSTWWCPNCSGAGLFRTAYAGHTPRDHLGIKRPAVPTRATRGERHRTRFPSGSAIIVQRRRPSASRIFLEDTGAKALQTNHLLPIGEINVIWTRFLQTFGSGTFVCTAEDE